MNILLQNTDTLHFVNPAAGWTPKHREARIFGHGLEALIFCYNSRIRNMRLLCEFADSRMNFNFPVTDERHG